MKVRHLVALFAFLWFFVPVFQLVLVVGVRSTSCRRLSVLRSAPLEVEINGINISFPVACLTLFTERRQPGSRFLSPPVRPAPLGHMTTSLPV